MSALSPADVVFVAFAIFASLLAIGSALALAMFTRAPLAFAAAAVEACAFVAAPLLALAQARSIALKFGAEGMLPLFVVPAMLAIATLGIGTTVANGVFAAAVWRSSFTK